MPGPDDDAPDDARDDDLVGPRPAPSDRPWVHPAELQGFRAAPDPVGDPPRPREWAIGLVSAAAGALVAVLVLVAFGALGGRERSPIPPPVVTSPDSPIDYTVAQRVAASVGPSVVTVAADVPGADGRVAQQQGSGIVLRTDRVMTSAHLVNGATKVEVSTKSGDSYPATVIGVDPATDLCLLLVDGIDDLPDPEQVEEPAVGDVVVAIGAGRGNEGWTSPGVVQERNWIGSYAGGAIAVAGLLATSTETTPETTGGGLFDPNGRIIGVLVTMPGGTRKGLAVPIDVAFDVLDQLDRTKAVNHGAIGVVFGTNKTGKGAGATVAGVVPDGPAAKAEPPLQPGDVIIATGPEPEPVRGLEDMIAEARRRRPTDQLELTVIRGTRVLTTKVELTTAGTGVETPFGPAG